MCTAGIGRQTGILGTVWMSWYDLAGTRRYVGRDGCRGWEVKGVTSDQRPNLFRPTRPLSGISRSLVLEGDQNGILQAHW
uniref:Uncharacterized protein n=1 Tax=Octopus bimaculoides TaxID=37653 RepID=A0A0L8H405_OCTBM